MSLKTGGNMLNSISMSGNKLKQHLIDDIENLPEPYLKELIDFADFLKNKYEKSDNDRNENPSWKRKIRKIKVKAGKDSSEYLREERDIV